jgi:hypothetical protein
MVDGFLCFFDGLSEEVFFIGINLGKDHIYEFGFFRYFFNAIFILILKLVFFIAHLSIYLLILDGLEAL